MGLSSNILWHQTDETGFYEILKSKKLRYSYSKERIIILFGLKPVAFPMISVSDYPLSEVGNNQWAYGNYCVGFKQSWGVKAGFSPIWYCSEGSRGLRQLNNLLDESIKTNSQKLFGVTMFMFAHMKLVQAPLETKTKLFRKYRFYDEREWRVVPYITETDQAEVMPFLTEENYYEFKKEYGGSSLLDIGVDFNYEDINYIIVEKEDDIKRTREIIGDRIHIFTKDEVMEDVVGVDHHEEIRPSPEQMDFEAAQRHMERMKKMFDEAWAKRKKT